MIANEMIRDALLNKKYLALCVSASERQAMNVLQYAYQQIKPLSPGFREETKTSFILANGSAVYSLPNNANTVRGFKADHVYLDEFAHFQDDKAMLEAILPSVSRGGRLTAVSTPLGKRGEFWRIWSEDDKFSHHEYPHTVCPDLVIEDMRGTLDEVSFEQEYCCQFIDESQSFFPYDLILSCVDDNLINKTAYEGENPIYVGVDFGKLIDSTVIVALEKGEALSRVLHIEEFQGTNFSEQLAFLEHIAIALKATRVSIDATGYGVPLLEQTQNKLGPVVEGVTFTNAVKERMITELRVAFEGRTIKIPRNQNLINQLHSLERTVSNIGTVRYRHEEGKHDDYVWALALAFGGFTGKQRSQPAEAVVYRRPSYRESGDAGEEEDMLTLFRRLPKEAKSEPETELRRFEPTVDK